MGADDPNRQRARRHALRAHLAQADLAALLATRLANVRYLTGFSGSYGALLLLHDRTMFFTDRRYERHAAARVEEAELVLAFDSIVAFGEQAAEPHHRPGDRRRAVMPTTNDLKNGMTLNIDGDLMNVVEFQHVKPGKGGAFVRTKLKNVRTGRVLDKTFRADEAVEVAILEKRAMQFLHRDEAGYYFMDTETYDQVPVEPTAVGDAARYMVEGSTPYLTFYEGTALGVELPAAVELEVRETEPGLKGDRVSGATKPATVETGAVVQVPLFVEVGDRVKVDTRSGAYLTRVQ